MIKYYDKSMTIMYLQVFLRDYFGMTIKEVNTYIKERDPISNIEKRKKVKRYIVTNNDPIKVTGYFNAQTYASLALYMAYNYPNEGYPYSYKEVTKGVWVPVSSYKTYYKNDNKEVITDDYGEKLAITPERLYYADYFNSTTVSEALPTELQNLGVNRPLPDDPINKDGKAISYMNRLRKGYYKEDPEHPENPSQFYDENDVLIPITNQDIGNIYLDLSEGGGHKTYYLLRISNGLGVYKLLGEGAFVYYDEENNEYYLEKPGHSLEVRPMSDNEIINIVVTNINNLPNNPLAISAPDRVLSYILGEVVSNKSTNDEIVRAKKLIYRILGTFDDPLNYNEELFRIVCGTQLEYQKRMTKEGQDTPTYDEKFEGFKVTGYIDPWTELLLKDKFSGGEDT